MTDFELKTAINKILKKNIEWAQYQNESNTENDQ